MRTLSGSAGLPQSRAMDLRKPPVIETSLGCFFTDIPDWNILHFGALWEKFRAKYPIVEFPPPVLQSLEPPITVHWRPGDSLVPIRALFTDVGKTQLVQLQTNLFLHNWRKSDESPNYEHYDHILPLFKDDWKVFTSFLHEQKLKRPQFTRCEMTYFNHLVRGEHWGVYEDLPKLFRVWRGFDAQSIFRNVEQAAFNVVQAVGKGKVNMVVSPGVRRSDGKELLQMIVTTTRIPTGFEDKDLFDGLDECHDIALKAFRDFLTDEALKQWGA
jgi:uncharacterized protein (TIGR04255 family)